MHAPRLLAALAAVSFAAVAVADEPSNPSSRAAVGPAVTAPAAAALAASAPAADPRRMTKPEPSAETLAWRDHLVAMAHFVPDGRSFGRARMGVSLARVHGDQLVAMTDDPAVAETFRAWDLKGAMVVAVVPGSPADLAGIVPGDVIVQYAGLWVDTQADLVQFASRTQVGRDVEVQVLRDGEVTRTWVVPVDVEEISALLR